MLAYPRLALISFSLLASIILIALSIMNIYFPETYDSIVNSRIAELFNLASSASFGSRVGSFANGWEVIKNYPFFGSFGHYFYYGGGYPHNFLYAWSNWGLFPFITIFVLLLVTTFQSLFNFLNRKEHKEIILVSYVTSVSFLHFFIVAPIDDISLGILIGLFVGIINEKRKSYPYL
tara:strand:- start:19 stop:549 length:531 start_codon:yes stop_codon:yes gene_type:complete